MGQVKSEQLEEGEGGKEEVGEGREQKPGNCPNETQFSES